MSAVPEYGTPNNAWKNVFEITAYHVGSLPEHLPVELEVGFDQCKLMSASKPSIDRRQSSFFLDVILRGRLLVYPTCFTTDKLTKCM